jgi:predicted Zn-dependent peptidase
MNYISGPSRGWILLLLFALGLILAGMRPVGAQASIEPQREVALNGLRLVLWRRPSDPNLELKLRIHSGSAFDLAGKAGTMAILSDMLFPEPTAHEYLTEELGGKLDVAVNYDSVDVDMVAPSSNFERMMMLLRNALVSTEILPDNFEKARAARKEIAVKTGAVPSTIADNAIARRLFGTFPYSNPIGGTPETLSRIDRADVLLARERFLNPNNSTLIVAGNFDPDKAMRAIRQLLGSWRKSENIIPPTFRQPSAPDPAPLVVDAPDGASAEIRIAVRGVSRGDAGFYRGEILARVIRARLKTLNPELGNAPSFVRNDSHSLPGMFVMGTAVHATETRRALESLKRAMTSATTVKPSPEELDRAKTEAIATFRQQSEKKDGLMDQWLDIDTYKLASLNQQIKSFEAVTANDVQQEASKLFSEGGQVSVIVTGNREVAADFARQKDAGNMEHQKAKSKISTPSPK